MDKQEPASDLSRARQVAESLDCVLEVDMQILARVTSSTCDNWRRRGTGPAYYLIGNRYLYPRRELIEFMRSSMRHCGLQSSGVGDL